MKNKSKLCSTGHGTGVIQPASLREILERDKLGIRMKQRLRRDRGRSAKARRSLGVGGF